MPELRVFMPASTPRCALGTTGHGRKATWPNGQPRIRERRGMRLNRRGVRMAPMDVLVLFGMLVAVGDRFGSRSDVYTPQR